MAKHLLIYLISLKLLWASISVCAETRFDEVLALPFIEPTDVLAYGEHPDQYGLLWRGPENIARPPPLIILIHGGCWLDAYDVKHLQPLASHLFAEGFNVWAPEYRRVMGAGGYPETFDDVAESIRFILKNQNSDDSWALVGHSAGGHLALWAASEPNLPRANITVGLAAITDLKAYASAEGSCPQSVAPLLGGDAQDQAFLYTSLSPVNRAFDSPLVLMQGLADPIVPIAQTEAMSAGAHQYLEHVDHFDLINPQRNAVNTLLTHLKRALEE